MASGSEGRAFVSMGGGRKIARRTNFDLDRDVSRISQASTGNP